MRRSRRVLVVVPAAPDAPRSGLELRHRALVRALGSLADVHVHALVHRRRLAPPSWDGVVGWSCSSDETMDATHLSSTGSEWMRTPTGHPTDAWFRESVDRELRDLTEQFDPDVVIGAGLATHAYLSSLRADGASTVLDQADVEAVAAREIALLPADPRHVLARRLVAQRTAELEARVVNDVDAVWVTSAHDARTLDELYPEHAPMSVVPNVIDELPEPTTRPTGASPVLFYPGSFGYPPNVDAGRRLIDEIWPAIQAQLPDSELVLAGVQSDRAFAGASAPGLTLTGSVTDLEPWWRRATMMPVPLRAGAGTRLKILEAFAFGVPVISTAKGFEGLDVEPSTHLLVADELDEWVARSVELHRYSERSHELVQASRTLVASRYSLDAMRLAIARALEHALEEDG